MDIENISSISCEKRNNYDKNKCVNLNPDKINNYLKSYDIKSFFDKNIFSLNDRTKVLKDIDKNKCADYCIDNEYKGFTYSGDKNICMMFKSHNLKNKINNDINKYNVQTFLKTKNTIDIKNDKDQLNTNNYFQESNNYGYMLDDFIKEVNVNNKNECMDSCINNNNKCKSIMYLEQPKECIFYNDKVIKKDKMNHEYDSYSTKNIKIKEHNDTINKLNNNNDNNDDYNSNYYCKLNNDKCTLDYKVLKKDTDTYEIPDRTHDTNIPLYNCEGIYSTNPFCTKEYVPNNEQETLNTSDKNYTKCENININENIIHQKQTLNNICKNNFGNEYIFDDNIFDMNTIIKCDNGDNQKKIKCKMSFSDEYIAPINENIDHIEHYANNNNKYTYESSLYIILLFIIIIIIIIIIYFYKKN